MLAARDLIQVDAEVVATLRIKGYVNGQVICAGNFIGINFNEKVGES